MLLRIEVKKTES